MAAIIPAIIGGAASLLGGIMQGVSNRRAEKRANQWNTYMSNLQYSRDKEMWDKANEYNSPSEQMRRLQQAGINPNVVYGGGNTTGNATATLPKYQAPGIVQNELPIKDSVLNMLGQYQDMSLRQAQTDNVKTDTRVKELNEARLAAERPYNELNASERAGMLRYNTGAAFNRWLESDLQKQATWEQRADGKYYPRNLPGKVASVNAQYQRNVQELEKTNTDISLLKARMEYQNLQNKYMRWGQPIWGPLVGAAGTIARTLVR